MISQLQILADSYKQGRHNTRPASQEILRSTWNAFSQALENFSITFSGIEGKQHYLNTLWLRDARNVGGRDGYDMVKAGDSIEISAQDMVGAECILQQKDGQFVLKNAQNKNISLADIPVMVSRFVTEIIEPKNTPPTVLYSCPERSPGYVEK